MRITLLAANGYLHDRRARARQTLLARAGHEVTVVAAGVDNGPDGVVRHPGAEEVVGVPSRRPVGRGRVGSWLRRVQPPALRERVLTESMVRGAVATSPDMVVPTTTAALDAAHRAAKRSGAVVLAEPGWPVGQSVDLVRWAPAAPATGASAHGGLDHHTPSWRGPTESPRPDRHVGRRLVLVYRRRAASPGRWLQEALERAGVEVRQVDEVVRGQDLDGADGVVVVESPHPAPRFEVRPDCPVGFWVHHGEHHLEMNVRIAEQLGVDHVLLAHSWHLAHCFGVPVTRFPFALPHADAATTPATAATTAPTGTTATGPTVGGRPWAQRSRDAGLVGSHLDGGGPYARRGELVARARAHLGEDRCAFLSGVTPTRMLEVYGDTRIVLNESGTRHHPITMRVFEAVGAGALLLTDHSPGLDQLFPDDLVAEVREPFEQQLAELLAAPDTADRAAAATAHARARHTYDHRVDELLAVLAATPARSREPRPLPPRDTVHGLVARDVAVQRLVQVGLDDLAAAHPDREVWTPDELGARMQPGTIEGVALRADRLDGLEEVVDAAWRYLYVDGPMTGLAEHLEGQEHTVSVHGDVRRIDLHASGYRIPPDVRDETAGGGA